MNKTDIPDFTTEVNSIQQFIGKSGHHRIMAAMMRKKDGCHPANNGESR